MKKNKNKKINESKLRYLYTLASKLPYKSLSRSKCKEFLEFSSKFQYRLKRAKLTICKSCKIVLIPKVNSVCGFTRLKNKTIFSIACNNCQNEIRGNTKALKS